MDIAHLNPYSLFMQAGLIGKSVILILTLASILCWYQIIFALLNVMRLKTGLSDFLQRKSNLLMCNIVQAGIDAQNDRFAGETVSETRQRVTEAMGRQASLLLIKLESGLTSLAVVASISPFIGLLGTVWGIMISFTSISESNDTSLAVVAPGIAEALATTAFGLLAAIPASVGYSALGAIFGKEAQKLNLAIEGRAIELMRQPDQMES
jgi:biopolymer transport protein TolQ